jgi:hypothetical protein
MRRTVRVTGLALLAAATALVAGCGDSDEEKAQEQVSSALSQAAEIQSGALSQAEELQSQALSQVGELTQSLGELTAEVPELPPTTEAEATEVPATSAGAEEPAEQSVGSEPPAAGGDLIAADDLEAALESAAGVSLAEVPGGAAGQGVAYSNQASMIQDGHIVFAYVLTDPQAAEIFKAVMPELPAVPGQSTTVAHKNAIVVYATLGQDDRSAAVEAAVKGL